MNVSQQMRRITRDDIKVGMPVITVEIPYTEFIARFGPRHSDHPRDWDASGPVELWFFELPWGHKITLEYHLTISQVNIYVESLEINAILDFLAFRPYRIHLHSDTITLLKDRHAVFTCDLKPTSLYRMDDNGNTALMHSYESRRVAEYHQKQYEALGHKQYYWVDQDRSEVP